MLHASRDRLLSIAARLNAGMSRCAGSSSASGKAPTHGAYVCTAGAPAKMGRIPLRQLLDHHPDRPPLPLSCAQAAHTVHPKLHRLLCVHLCVGELKPKGLPLQATAHNGFACICYIRSLQTWPTFSGPAPCSQQVAIVVRETTGGWSCDGDGGWCVG